MRHVLLKLVFIIMCASFNVFATETLVVTYPSNTGTSPKLSELHGSPNVSGPTVIHQPLRHDKAASASGAADAALQTKAGQAVSITPGSTFNFQGLSIYQGGYIPSDNNIAVGPNHIVEVVNSAIAIYDKSGVTVQSSVPLSNIWLSLTGSGCAANNGGDPLVQYDRQADRWIITQLGSLSSPYSECFAVSKTNNPTGAYNLYSYSFGTNLNDYPKIGIWPTATNSAYLATYNLFANGSSFAGAEVCAYDRAAMLRGDVSPASVCWTNVSGGSYLPGDLDGTSIADATPALFMNLSGTNFNLCKAAPNFTTPASSSIACNSVSGIASYSAAGNAPQPSTTRTLDSLSDRLMNRLAVRVFSDHTSMVVNHSVVANGVSGVRWYELRSTANPPVFSIYQQGTYAPNDGKYRWMGSAAMDKAGDIALGYSVSNSSNFPSIAYTGRASGDTLGSMGTEFNLYTGAGSQTGYNRWGDYTSMQVDPIDDCTFWYVNEYLPTTSSAGWYTRIGSFKFDSCTLSTSPDFSISASPASRTIQRGNSTSFSISLAALNSFNSPVTLANNCSSQLGCTFTGNPVSLTSSPASSALNVTSTTSSTPGTYSITTTGTNSTLIHTTTVNTTLTAPINPSVTPSSLTLTRGRSVTTSLAFTSDSGTSFPATLSVTGLPSKVTASFSSSLINLSVVPTSAILTLTANKQTRAGSYTIRVNYSGGGNTSPISVSIPVIIN